MRLIDADALKFRDVKVTTNEIDIFGFGDYIVEERKGILQEEIWNAPTIDVEPHWIPCEERLPENSNTVLITKKSVFGNDNVVCFGWYIGDNHWAIINYKEPNVIAWMPLPEPYIKRKDNE